jgi:hypothetical protein
MLIDFQRTGPRYIMRDRDLNKILFLPLICIVLDITNKYMTRLVFCPPVYTQNYGTVTLNCICITFKSFLSQTERF